MQIRTGKKNIYYNEFRLGDPQQIGKIYSIVFSLTSPFKTLTPLSFTHVFQPNSKIKLVIKIIHKPIYSFPTLGGLSIAGASYKNIMMGYFTWTTAVQIWLGFQSLWTMLLFPPLKPTWRIFQGKYTKNILLFWSPPSLKLQQITSSIYFSEGKNISYEFFKHSVIQPQVIHTFSFISSHSYFLFWRKKYPLLWRLISDSLLALSVLWLPEISVCDFSPSASYICSLIPSLWLANLFKSSFN